MNNHSLSELYNNLMSVVSIKFVLILFITISIVLIVKKIKLWLILPLAGLAGAISYALISHGFALSFWGLTGDEATIAAIYNTFAHSGFFSDFAYHGLPPFYPPFFFWIFAAIGKIMSWNGVVIAKFASICSFFIIPLIVYWLFKFLNSRDKHPEELPSSSPLLFSLLIFILVDVDMIFGKPYEVLAAAVTVLWTIYLIRKIRQNWHWKDILIFGVVGGIIFMTYYLWLVFATIAIALYALLSVPKKEQFIFYGRLIAVAGVALIIASPYLFPLIFAYHKLGTENWQTAFFTADGLVFNIKALTELSWRGILLFTGLVAAIYYRRNEHVKPAACLFASAYLWWVMGLAMVYFFNTPFQEFRGFGLIDRLSLGFAAAYATPIIYGHFKNKLGKGGQEAVLIIGILIISLYLPCGTFIDNDKVRERMIESKNLYQNEVGLFAFLKKSPMPAGLTLSSGLAELPAFVPINTFIYFNQDNNHPAAHFSERLAYLKEMTYSPTAERFFKMTDTPYGKITRLILFRDKSDYVIYFHIDQPVTGIAQYEIRLKGDLVSEKYFTKVYEDYYYSVFDVK
jgi:hypothetical protein